MLRRRTFGKKELMLYYEKLTTIGSGTWIVPSGCTKVDAFVVSAGGDGTMGTIDTNTSSLDSGHGGSGGSCNTYTNIAVSGSVSYYVGGNSTSGFNSNSYFLNTTYISTTLDYVNGNGGRESYIHGGTRSDGGNGGTGSMAFNGEIDYGYYYGAGGGGGGSYLNYLGDVSTVNPGTGGTTGGGSGYAYDGTVTSPSFYGAGGGGGYVYYSKRSGVTSDPGIGYQGIIILRYYAYKK